MVLDTSAVLALLLGEADAARYARAIAADARRLMSAFSVLEAGIVVVARKGEPGGRELDLLLHHAHVEVVALTPEQAEIARSAWLAFGKGRHPAALNVGDCCAYALARYSGEPLLFKGDDFARTDVATVRLD